MGLFNTSKTDKASRPIFPQPQFLQDYPGGGTLENANLPEGTILRTGTLLSINEQTSLVNVLKTATIAEAATNTDVAYKILKTVNDNDQPHLLIVGDLVAFVVGGKSYAITAIDTSNANYDTITVGTTLGVVLAAGDVLFHSAASGATAGKLKYDVNGILRNDVTTGKNTFVPVIRAGAVYNRRLPFKAPQAVKDALKGLIIFSDQR